MFRPTRYYLDGRTFVIKWEPVGTWHNVRGQPRVAAEFERATGTIKVDPRATDASIRFALAHELLHAVWTRAGLPKSGTGKVSEEEAVSALESWFLALLQENPVLVRHLMEE